MAESKRARKNAAVESFDIDDLPPLRDETQRPKLSVSAHGTPETGESVRPDVEDVVLAPRVIDDNAFTDLTSTVETLVADATTARGELEEVIERAREALAEPERSTEQLQERLKLGARMLKAFQTQIDRIETTMSDLADQHQAVENERDGLIERLTSVEREAEAAIERVERRASEIAGGLLARLEREIESRGAEATDIDARITRAIEARMGGEGSMASPQAAIDERIDAALDRIDARARQRRTELEREAERFSDGFERAGASIEKLEEAAASATTAQHRGDEMLRQLRSEIESAREENGRAVELRAALDAEVRRASARIDGTEGRIDDVIARVDDGVDRAAAMDQRLARTLRAVGVADERLAETTAACERLEQLIEHLAPWQKLLCEAPLDENGLPVPAMAMVETLRVGIGRDMSDLAGTLQSVSRQINDLGLPNGRPNAMTETKSTTVRPDDIVEDIEAASKPLRPMGD